MQKEKERERRKKGEWGAWPVSSTAIDHPRGLSSAGRVKHGHPRGFQGWPNGCVIYIGASIQGLWKDEQESKEGDGGWHLG